MTKEKTDPPAEPAEPKSTELIDKANEAAKRLEEANTRLEEANTRLEKNLAKQEALAVEKTLGGQAEAGTQQKEETPEEYAEKVLANDAETKA